MRREDVRDEALGALLRRAAETAADAPGPARVQAVRLGPGDDGKIRRLGPRRIRARIAGGVALAAGLAAALTVPAVVRTRADREFLAAAAGHLSRTLIREDSSFLADLPGTSYLESAAADWAGSFFPADADL